MLHHGNDYLEKSLLHRQGSSSASSGSASSGSKSTSSGEVRSDVSASDLRLVFPSSGSEELGEMSRVCLRALRLDEQLTSQWEAISRLNTEIDKLETEEAGHRGQEAESREEVNYCKVCE